MLTPYVFADALVILDTIAESTDIHNYQPYHAARADILKRMGLSKEAIVHFDKAIQLTENEAEKIFLKSRKDR